MKTITKTLIISCALFSATQLSAQQDKIWISGAARGIIYSDSYEATNQNDTTTPRLTQSGHAMVDLGVNIQPNKDLLIKGMVRVRNDYGGFWGSGVTFDVRQLTIKGVIGGFLGYQIGDIDYKLSPYTFRNNVSLVNQRPGALTDLLINQVQYDLFYMPDNTWRQQGVAMDFALGFNQLIEEMQFNAFTTRLRQAEGNFDDRLFSGASVIANQGKFLKIGGNYANLWDLEGTSSSNISISNPVLTGTAELALKINDIDLNLATELGRSTLQWEGDAEAPVLEDYFYDVRLKGNLKELGLSAELGYRNVGPDFRSAGAQSMRINFAAPTRAFNQVGNANSDGVQEIRPLTFLDLYRDPSLYNTQITPGLAAFNVRYDAISPYGRATPNRAGFNLKLDYEDSKNWYKIGVNADLLGQVVGVGTDILKSYTGTQVNAEINVHNLLGLEDRKILLYGNYGMQSVTRDGDTATNTNDDLANTYYSANLEATLLGDLSVIAEYRNWQSNGNHLTAERNEYSQVDNLLAETIDYNENMFGLGLKYDFSEKTEIRFMWQNFSYVDNTQAFNTPYEIGTYTIFFNMNF
jgi:hypothetical protein